MLHQKKFELFHSLHHQEKPLLLPNIWEPMGALILEDIGYPAVATSSYAIAFNNGVHDGENLSFTSLLQQVKQIAQQVSIPLSVDFEKGYAKNNISLRDNIIQLLQAGVVGINLEDTEKTTGRLVPIKQQYDKIKLIKETASSLGFSIFINARTDGYISSDNFTKEECIEKTIERGQEYKKAGADSLFPIFMSDTKEITRTIKEVNLPININITASTPSLQELERLGIKRISLASSFQKIAFKKMRDFARNLQDYKGMEEVYENDITADYLNGLLDNPSK